MFKIIVIVLGGLLLLGGCVSPAPEIPLISSAQLQQYSALEKAQGQFCSLAAEGVTVYVPNVGELEVPAAALVDFAGRREQNSNLPGQEAVPDDFEPGVWERLAVCWEMNNGY